MRRIVPLLAVVALVITAGACGGGAKRGSGPVLGPTPTPNPRALQDIAEARYLPAMRPELAELVLKQPWFQEMTQARLDLIAAVQQCERASAIKGEQTSVRDLLAFAAEQPWYTDGLDDREAVALTGVFQAYSESLSDDRAPPIGPILGSTLRDGLFDVLQLPQTGQVAVLVSADDPALGRQALDLAKDAMPKVEGLVGAFPYHFIHIQVTPDLPEIFAGVSYDQFIALSTEYVDAETVIHELTHSTLYGIFPIWFEEGLAHFVEYYLTGSLEEATQDFRGVVNVLGGDARLKVGVSRSSSFHGVLSERAQGFLFIRGLYDMWGIEGLTKAVLSFRKRTMTDQELLTAITQQAPAEQRQQMADFLCQSVVGATHNYCVLR
ncbi:MAG TPA: hypothetical protein VII57_05345 [Dehalococcoidia bacterium]